MKKAYIHYYLFKASFDLILAYPLYVLIFQNRGLNETSIAWLLALWSLSVVALELPMGVLSDKTDRKKVLFAASIAKALAFTLWIPAQSFLLILAGFILWGLSEALHSGTEEAWLYESLADSGRGAEYRKIRGRGRFLSSMAIGLSSILGGFGIRFGETFVLGVSAAASVLAAGAVLFFDRPPKTGEPDEDEESRLNFPSMVRNAFADIRASRSLLTLTILASAVLLIPGVLEEWDPVFLTSLGMLPVHLGLWLAIRYACESAGALLAHRADRLLSSIPRILAIAALGALVLPLIGITGSLIVLPLYGLYYALYALLSVQVEARMQDLVPGSRRATVMSVRSLLDNLVAILLILGTGYLAELRDWKTVWTASGALVILICALLLSAGGREQD